MDQLKAQGLQIHESIGENYNVFGVVGDTSRIDPKRIEANPHVDSVVRVSSLYKKASRLFHPDDTIVEVNGIRIGGKEKLVVIGGPCSVEGEDMVVQLAKDVKAAGCDASWWCLQTPYQSIRFSRHGKCRHSGYGCGT